MVGSVSMFSLVDQTGKWIKSWKSFVFRTRAKCIVNILSAPQPKLAFKWTKSFAHIVYCFVCQCTRCDLRIVNCELSCSKFYHVEHIAQSIWLNDNIARQFCCTSRHTNTQNMAIWSAMKPVSYRWRPNFDDVHERWIAQLTTNMNYYSPVFDNRGRIFFPALLYCNSR